MGRRDWQMYARPRGPCSSCAVRSVQWQASGQRSLRLYGESMEPRERGMHPHFAGAHK